MLGQLITRLTGNIRERFRRATYQAATEGGAAGLEEALRDLTEGEVTVSFRVEGGSLRLTEDVQTDDGPDLAGMDRPQLMRLARERGVEYPRKATAEDLRKLLS